MNRIKRVCEERFIWTRCNCPLTGAWRFSTVQAVNGLCSLELCPIERHPVCEGITPEILRSVSENFENRLRLCLRNNGGHLIRRPE